MSKEPEVFCPKCGMRAVVIVWFTDEPGVGFGSANCPCCGGIDYKVKRGRVTESVLVNPEEMKEDWEEVKSPADYDREVLDYMLEIGLV